MNPTHEPVAYDHLNFPGIVLHNVEVHRCPNCGDSLTGFPHSDELHRTLVREIIRKPGPLAGLEIRFLRNYLGYSEEELAAKLDLDASQIEQWEHDTARSTPGADRLARLLAARDASIHDRLPEILWDDDATTESYELEWTGAAWRAVSSSVRSSLPIQQVLCKLERKPAQRLDRPHLRNPMPRAA